jgi:hypothetical protein
MPRTTRVVADARSAIALRVVRRTRCLEAANPPVVRRPGGSRNLEFRPTRAAGRRVAIAGLPPIEVFPEGFPAMKLLKSVTRCAAVVIAMLGVAVHADARPLAAIQKAGKIVIATEGQYAPFNFFQGSKLAGFEVDVAEAMAAKMGLKVEWKALSFDALLTGLKQDRWDMVIASHGITEERSKAVTFTEPHYCSGGVIVAKDPRCPHRQGPRREGGIGANRHHLSGEREESRRHQGG